MSLHAHTTSNHNDDDDDSSNIYYTDAEPMVVKRPRSLRTENTPVSSSSSSSTTTELRSRQRLPSPSIGGPDHDGDRRRSDTGHNLLAVGIRPNEPSIQDDRFTEYQREDGLTGLPPQGQKDSKDSFNLDYWTEYKRRLEMLEQHPDFAFGFIVLGFLNGDVFEILDEGQFKRGIERDIARAKEEARKQLSRAETLNELRRETAERDKQLKLTNAEIKMLQDKSKQWQDARSRFLNDSRDAAKLLVKNDFLATAPDAAEARKVLFDRGLANSSQQLFDLMARIAWMRYGNRGLLNRGFSSDIEQFFRRLVAAEIEKKKIAESAKELMPQIADIAIYMATLKALSNSRGLLSEVVKNVTFPPGSAYAAKPELFANDAAALAKMVMPDAGVGQAVGPVTFKEISLLLYSHINNMIAQMGFAEADKIAKPTQIVDRSTSTITGRRTKKIYGAEVDVNVNDELLGRAALGEKKVFTEQELLTYKQTMFTNNEWIKTITAVQRILQPLYTEGFGKLFFVDVPRDTEMEDRLYNESRYPIEDHGSVRTVFEQYRTNLNATQTSVAEIFAVAFFIIKVSIDNKAYNSTLYDGGLYESSSFDALFDRLYSYNNVATDWLRYERNLRDSVVKRTLSTPMAKILWLMHDELSLADGTPLVFSEPDRRTLDEYLKLGADASINERRNLRGDVLDIFDNRVPFRKELAPKTSLESIYTSPSNRSFKEIVDKYSADPVFPVPRELERLKNELTQSLEIYRKKVNDALTKTPQQVNKEIVDNLTATEFNVSRQWASQPFNSGFMKLSWRFMSCLADATQLVRRECPNLAWIGDEDLQRNPRTITDFAHLVANKILIVNATNPGEYLRDKTIPDLNILVRNNIEALRRVPSRSQCSSGFGTPTALSVSAANVRVLPLKRGFSQYFS